MTCKIVGTSNYDCDFVTLSGTPPDIEECAVDPSQTGVFHVVVVTPTRPKYHEVRVTGRFVAEPATAKAKFVGPSVLLSNIEWQEVKSIDIAAITFDSAEIRHIRSGSENVKTVIEERNRWSLDFSQIDQDDLTFTIRLT